MSYGEISRRTLLRASSALAIGTATTAGCLGSVPGVGQSGGWSWFPAPDELDIDSDHYGAGSFDLQSYREHEDEFSDEWDGIDEEFATSEETTDLDFDEATEVHLGFSSGLYFGIIIGSFDVENIDDELDDRDFDDDDYESYTVYTRDGSSEAFGIKSDVVIRIGGFGEIDYKDTIETIIDARNEEADRYVDENEAFSTATSAIGSGTRLIIQTYDERDDTVAEEGTFEHAVASAQNRVVDGETTTETWIRVFEEADDVDLDDIEEWTETEQFDDYDDVSVSADGRVARVSGTIDSDELHDG